VDVVQLESELIVKTYQRPDLVFHHGQGAYLFDTTGKRYLDFASGIAVNALGHADPAWVAAVTKQASELTHVSNLFHTEPQVRLAQRLVATSFADRVFFCNSGAEANEAALKFARKRAYAAGNRDKTGIVAFENGFHGRTLGALSVTHNPRYREPFAPLIPNVHFAPFDDVEAAREAIGADTCAVIVEPIQGEGGVHTASTDFLQALRARCTEVDATLIFDEVQCGLGRTGHLWAHQAYGVEPDILTAAKPLANGLPIGATLVTEKVASAIEPGDHGSTFAAGPLVCRAAEVVLERVSDPAFLRRVQSASQRLLNALQQVRPLVTDIRGAGLLIGIELDRPAADIVQRARQAGLIIITAGPNIVRLAPPLIVNDAQIDWCVETLHGCLAPKGAHDHPAQPVATEAQP
jgi:predicted acetylornithine/succinylornithine family transaminase